MVDLGRRTAMDSVSALRDAAREQIETSYERLVEFVTDRSHVLLIAETARAGPLGFLLMLDDVPDEVTGLPQAFVAYMAVEPEARRRGVAARLLGAAQDAAHVRGLPNLALMVTEDNIAARELYAQAGFATERRLLCKRLPTA
ncbi:MAG: GNAT family N-acetyltransferase [Candidatus Eremiobacteraeota bacterium]|nr:GNAT family N-acetyltransferase [Candidatus Eremiobacteraeota bacterium]MBC5803978.1 GNAT family N-acetyltransferase [Candidatus Eremiobacteraeota bacterium]MBC5820365.1 GNAT family N-acetyltransferase [Candidatus Eremiobacteraeota bacterium]